MVGTHGGRVDRPSVWPWLVPVTALLAGTLFASSVRASQGEDLRPDQGKLPDLIRSQTRSNEEREGQLAELQAKVDASTARLAPGDLRTQQLERQSNELAPAAGRTPVVGPAVQVTLDDAKLMDGQIPAGADPDDYVIHQQDVQAVVNALWAGGAEAMMLQDQRVISTSAVRCVGNTLILQGRVYSPPYVITAIGDTDRMRSALDSDADVANLREWSIAVGLGYDVRVPGEQELPAYSGSIVPEHAAVPAVVTARRLVGWAGEVLLTLGALLLLFAAWQLWWTDVVADRAQDRIVTGLESRFAQDPAPDAVGGNGIRAVEGADGAFAVVRIPRFGAGYARPVLEGTGRDVLALGVGHYAGTAGPGAGRQLRPRRAPHHLRAPVPRRRPARRR